MNSEKAQTCQWLACCAYSYRTDKGCKKTTNCILMTIFIVAMLIFMITMLAMHVNIKVAQDEYAVKVNEYTTEVSAPLEQGTYTIKVGDKLLRFKRTYEVSTVDNVSCITKDKVNIFLFLSIQFQYLKDYIVDGIMKQFKDKETFDNFLDFKLTSSIISSCSNFTADDFYTSSSRVEATFYSNCFKSIQDSNIGVSLIFLQLQDYQFPQLFNDSTTRKLAIAQSEITELNNRQSQIVQSQTDLLLKQAQANRILTNATNTARSNINRALNDAQVIQQQWLNKAQGYLQIKQELNFTDDQLLNFIRTELLASSTNKNLYLSMSSSFLAI